MVTVTDRFSGPSNQLTESLRLRQTQIRLVFYHMWRPHLADWADCQPPVYQKYWSSTEDDLHLRRPVKNDLGLKKLGVFNISCECGQVYIGQTGCSVNSRIKKHYRQTRLAQPEKSAVAENSVNQDHKIRFPETEILATNTGHLDRLIREAIEL